MAAKWFHPDVMDDGLSILRASADGGLVTTMHLISAYAVADSRATVVANSLGSVSIIASDGVLENGSAANTRRVRIIAKTITASATDGAPDLHIALIDATKVYAVTDETSDQPITSGNQINVPTFNMQNNQPT